MQDEKQSVILLPGHNILRLNYSTMEQAVEYWLNNVVLRQPVTVVSVKERNTDNVFEVEVTEAVREGD